MSEPVETRRPQPLVIRLTHWLNIVFLTIVAGSGLQILVAYPFLGPRGHLFMWYPFQGQPPPAPLRLGMWLGGARHLHFAFAWLLLVNGLVYLGYYTASGEWRRRMFQPARDAKHALLTGLHYLRIRPEPAPIGLYNGLQRAAYTSAIVLGVLEVLSGLAIWKPVQLHWLTMLFMGYDGARAVHLLGLVAIAFFVVGHLIMVFTHPRTLLDMITGGKRHE